MKNHGLDEHELRQLSQYNSECARGVMHTDEWREHMLQLQERFDAASGQVG